MLILGACSPASRNLDLLPFPAIWATTPAVLMPPAAGFPDTFLYTLFCSSHIITPFRIAPQEYAPFSKRGISTNQ